MSKRLGSSVEIGSAKVFTGSYQSDMQKPGFVACPTGALPAQAGLQVRQVRACIRASILAGLPPERKPLSRMSIADSLHRAHDDKHDAPHGYEHQMTLSGLQTQAEGSRVESPEPARLRNAI